MRILLPDADPNDVRKERTRRRRSRAVFLGLGAVVVLAGLYAFPGLRRPAELYSEVDQQVVTSLFESRQDYPLTRIDVGGRIWSYRRAGEGPEAIVFLHGFGGSSDIWWQQMRSLQDRYVVIAMNYGRVRSLDEAAAGVRAAMDAEGIDRAHVVGTSLGGYLAQFFASRSPERVRSLVLANTFPPGPWIRGAVRVRGALAPVLPTWVLKSMLRRSVVRDVYPASGNSALVRDYLVEQAHSVSRSEYLTRIRLLRGDFDAPDIGGARVPTLIVEADNDPLVPPEARESLKSTYPRARVVTLADVGHFPYLNRPALYTRTLEAFFEALRPPTVPDQPDAEATPGDAVLAGTNDAAASADSVSGGS